VEWFQPAKQAVSTIGTNAIPFLLRWNVGETPIIDSLDDAFWKLPTPLRHFFIRIDQQFHDASVRSKRRYVALGFEILGTNAVAALPELQRQFMTTTNRAVAYRSALAMQYLGVNAFDFFIGILRTNQTNFTASLLIERIGRMSYLGTNAMPAVPLLLDIAQDTNSFPEMAAVSLAQLGLCRDRVVPILTNLLASTNRHFRVAALEGLLRVGAQVAVPRQPLQTALVDSDVGMRDYATNVVKTIAPEILSDSWLHR
jgi:hypothetical protein